MCLAVPGKVTSCEVDSTGLLIGTVDFGGVRREINLACVPDAQPGDYVLVHAGVALAKLDPQEAARTLALIREVADAAG
jgi:hydrogenase expression/formation protein HypC